MASKKIITRSKKDLSGKPLAMVLPLKKASKSKKKAPVEEEDAGAEEVPPPPPKPSQSDIARKKLAVLSAAKETSEAKRLVEEAEFQAAAKFLEDCVVKETRSERQDAEHRERKKRSLSRSRSRSPERRHSRSSKPRSRSPKRKSRSPRRRSRSPMGRRSRSKSPVQRFKSPPRQTPIRGRDRDTDHTVRSSQKHDERHEAPRSRGRSRSPRDSYKRRSRSRSPRRTENSSDINLPVGSSRGSSRKGQDNERISRKGRKSVSPVSRKETSSENESGEDQKGGKSGGESRGNKDANFLFRRAASIPDEVEKMGKVILEMDQICTGVAVRAAMLLDAVVHLIPSGARDHEKRSLFASYVGSSVGNGSTQTHASNFGLEKLGTAILSGLCLHLVRRILLCSTADIPLMAFSAANATILGLHDPSLPKLAAKDSKLVECSPHTTFNDIILFLVRWARIVNLVDPVYGSAISGLTCVVVDLHTSRESIMVIHEYVQLMRKLVAAGSSGETFFPLFFVLQTQTLDQARLAVAEKARVKAGEAKTIPDGGLSWQQKQVLQRQQQLLLKGIPKSGAGKAGLLPNTRDKLAITDVGFVMPEDTVRISSCHDFNNGTTCRKTVEKGRCNFPHVCNICMSSDHGRSTCPKRTAKKE